jgi:peroxiredoxin/outer membrane lipoprotein-sorting protein
MGNLRSEIFSSAIRLRCFRATCQEGRLRRGGCATVIALGLLIYCCGLGAPKSRAADGPDGLAILKQSASAYQGLKSYRADITLQSIDGSNVAERKLTETGSGASLRSEDADPKGRLRVRDGRTEWTLDRATNEYTKTGATNAAAGMIAQLAQVDQNVKDASMDDEELYWRNGTPVKVYIVEVTRTSWPADAPASAQWVTYTIDEQTHEIYKAMTYTSGATEVALYTLTQRNESVPSAAFAFRPPASAKEVSSLPAEQFRYRSILGMEAPDFSLKTAAGRSYSLHDFRGKAVVIDFVASWCPPCLAQTPYIQQVNDAYSPNDLEVFALDVGESADQTNEFALNSNFTFPVLVGAEPDVTEKYFVGDYPTTYVIDRTGHIVFKATGTDNPGGFLAAVKSAIIGKD